MPDPQNRVLILEKRYRRQMVLTVCLIALMLLQAAYTLWATRRESANGQIVRARGLIITDEKGTERIVIGAPLPDPAILGKRHKRDGPVSGLIIADATGTERGGYVTDDQAGNALLTLDGRGFQTVVLLAEPDGATTFRLWDRTHSSITMGAWDDGPFLNLKAAGAAVFVQPPGNPQASDPRPLFH
ncbi:MAG TPA: hypothetical protein VN924_08960 [Bryobacteraceae bacterium]|nr:hypothetical protein [Bryobacteraceae bacterium]